MGIQLAEELVTALIGLVGPAKAKELIDQQAVDAANYAADLLEANLKDN